MQWGSFKISEDVIFWLCVTAFLLGVCGVHP